MQMFVMLMMVALIVHDAAAADLGLKPLLTGAAMPLTVLSAYAVLAAIIAGGCFWVQRIMTHSPGRARPWVRRLEVALNASRAVIVALFLTQIYVLGGLMWLRETLGNWILLNEVLAILPALATVAVTWWAYYPIDRRMREAALIRQLDRGDPVWPIWTRGQYLLSQVRHQLLLMMVPLLALLGWTQIVDSFLVPEHPWIAYRSAFTLSGGLAIFLAAPLMIRHVWDTIPLAEGELRTRLLALCDCYHVRIRELLLWRTYGGIVNGAVMGLIGKTRYILLTDGLIERLEDDEVEAVMAHELGHVRRHHMPWLAICAITVLMAWSTVLEYAIMRVESLPGLQEAVTASYWREMSDVAMIGLLLGGWYVAFGYISRRFERQADTFAAQHLTQRLAEDRGETAATISSEGAEIMSRALFRVSALSHAPADRPSWRHGSITWRANYLRSLVGCPLYRCPIDGEVQMIRGVCVLLGLAALALTYGG
ncbi:MAG: M48 family metallopeptidase [Phycisphaeraceae bacterium]